MAKDLPPKSTSTLISLMRYCHVPMYFKSPIRKLRLNETYLLGKISCDSEIHTFHGQAFIRKVRGAYQFEAVWTLPTKKNRADVLSTGTFKLEKGGVLIFDSESSRSIKSFALVCRYLSFLNEQLTREEKLSYINASAPVLFQGLHLDSENITRSCHHIKTDDGKSTLSRIDYGMDFIVGGFAAIVEKAAFLGVIEQ